MTIENKSDGGEAAAHAKKFGDAQMEAVMGRLLQAGVLLAAAVVVVGGVLYLHGHAGEQPNYRTFTARPIDLKHVGALLRGVGEGNSVAILEVGILLLVATPVARVIFAVAAFMAERDRLYVAISLTVLGVLLFGLLRGV
jgi:uncharacterized membrane protein